MYARSITTGTIQAPRKLLRLACETQDRSTRRGTRIIALASRHSVADHSSGLVAWRSARLILRGLWGYYPGGGLGLILIIVIILALMGRI